MSRAVAATVSPWRDLATAAYYLAVLVVLAPGIGFVFGTWPPHPSLLSWRHVGSDMLLSAVPLIGAAAVAILLAAKVRNDVVVLRIVRSGGLIATVLGVPFTILYAVDSMQVYRGIPAPQAPTFVGMEIRMFTLLALGLAVFWLLSRAAGSAIALETPVREGSAEAS